MFKKAHLLCFSLLLLFTSVNAQQEGTAIRKRAGEYFTATEKKDWVAVLDMIYPKLFNFIPRENMAEVFSELENEGMTINVRDFEIDSVSAVEEYEGEKFALLNYQVGMTIRLTSQEFRDSAMQVLFLKNFQSAYGELNVVHQPADYSFGIHATRSMYAVLPEGGDQWFFVENDPSQAELTALLVPEPIRKSLGKADKQN